MKYPSDMIWRNSSGRVRNRILSQHVLSNPVVLQTQSRPYSVWMSLNGVRMRSSQEKSVLLCATVLLLFATIIGSGIAQTTLESKVDDLMSELLQCRSEIFGLAMSVVKDDKVLLRKGYGVSDRERGTPVDEYTLFGIASLTKAFTTTLLMKVLEGNKEISVNTPVSQILGKDFRFYDEMRTKYATVRDLMSHRMGLPSHNYIRFQEHLSRKQLARLFRYMEPTGEFRSSYQYNNIVYGLLTHITEVLGNDTWEKLMSREIFEPLEMMNTTFRHTISADIANRAIGYVFDRERIMGEAPLGLTRQWGSLGGSGSILSNAVDMTRWMQFNLGPGKNQNEDTIIKSYTLRNIHRPWVTMDTAINRYIKEPTLPATFVVDRYSMAWRNGFYRGLPTLSHTGSTFGFRAMTILYPEQNLGIFLALNGEDSGVFARTALLSYIADIVLNHEPWLNGTTVCTFPMPWTKAPISVKSRPTNTSIPPNRPLSAYIGSYRNVLYGDLDIAANDTRNCTNCLSVTLGISTWLLYPSAFRLPILHPKNLTDHFVALGTGLIYFFRPINVQFHLTEEGFVQRIVIFSFNARDPPVFKRVGYETNTPADTEDTAAAIGFAISTDSSFTTLIAPLLAVLVHYWNYY